MSELKKRILEKKETMEGLDLDTFGDIMDDVIRKSAVGLLVKKDAGSDEWTTEGVGCGAVMDLYVFLNALGPIYRTMLCEMGGKMDGEKLADALVDLVRDELKAAAEEEP